MVRGELTVNPYGYVPGLVKWDFNFTASANEGYLVKLNKTDCESHGHRNQLVIRKKTVKIRAPTWACRFL